MSRVLILALLIGIFSSSAVAKISRLFNTVSTLPQLIGPVGEDRITLGEPTTAQPFAGALVFYVNGKYGDPFCTSSLIAPDRVLTAAHCFPPIMYHPKIQLKFVYGLSDIREASIEENKNNPNVSIITFDIDEDVEIHDDYKGESNFFLDDIAIIELPTPVTAPGLKVMRLAKTEILDNVHDVGWGKMNCTHASPDTLRKAEANVISQAECTERLNGVRGGIPVPDSQICSFFKAMGELAAVSSGDSGGPLYQDGTDPIQIGVLSHGYFYPKIKDPPKNWACINPYFPQVFVRVSYYQDWIQKIVPSAQFV
ncbi:unnamed protein product [Allacma fusca]|uniref:Peptidase S1 domain-containing protein n=1 Tax=Allacma fusca TaxID=39272 RepID=A0A8J2KRU8_9HEXA|nr:unnamed protein product [Allacma fusca]